MWKRWEINETQYYLGHFFTLVDNIPCLWIQLKTIHKSKPKETQAGKWFSEIIWPNKVSFFCTLPNFRKRFLNVLQNMKNVDANISCRNSAAHLFLYSTIVKDQIWAVLAAFFFISSWKILQFVMLLRI